MFKRHIGVLLSLIGVAAIVQLLFFWLDPHVACSMTVYIFITCLTVVNTALSAVLWVNRRPGRIPAAMVVGSAVWAVMMAAGGILLGLDAAVRTAVFCLSIFCVLYLVCVAPLLGMAAAGPAGTVPGRPVTGRSSRMSAPGTPPPLP